MNKLEGLGLPNLSSSLQLTMSVVLALVGTGGVDSQRMQMEPSSPIRQDTSYGSTHIVSSLGRSEKSCSRVSPMVQAAWPIKGSILWLILRHLYPEPLHGAWGNQWCWQCSAKASSKEWVNSFSRSSDKYPVALSNLATKLAAVETSVLIFEADAIYLISQTLNSNEPKLALYPKCQAKCRLSSVETKATQQGPETTSCRLYFFCPVVKAS